MTYQDLLEQLLTLTTEEWQQEIIVKVRPTLVESKCKVAISRDMDSNRIILFVWR